MRIKDYLNYFLVIAVVMACSLNSRAQISVINGINCNGDTSGILIGFPSGWGTLPYSYLWSTGDTTQAIINLPAGTYSVTITDGWSNDSVFSVTLTDPPLLTTMIYSTTPVSCFNGYDGLATAVPTGGNSPYSYNWSNGDHNATATALSSGIYSVTVTDFNGCTYIDSISITQPTQVTSVISSTVDVTCHGGSNGSANISAAGGIPAYTYSWSNGSSGNLIAGVTAGLYNVTITDANGCTTGNSVVITEPTPINLPLTNQTDVSCYGGNNGSVTIIANGGIAPYTYLWSNSDITPTINNLAAGTYSLVVTDSTGCTANASVTVSQPAPLIINIDQVIPSDCDGHDNGGVQISIPGGVAPYNYYWREINFDSIYTTQDISNVRGGDYEIMVTDILGCIGMDTIIIPNNSFVPVTINYQEYICNGALGSVSILADSADSLQYYTYNWNSTYNNGYFITNDSVYSTSTSFLAGNYMIYVTELSTGCVNYFNFTINQSATPMVVTSTVTHNTCYGNHGGSIRLYVNGGDPMPGYHCSWTGPYGFTSTSFVIGGLLSGDYNYTVTDDSSCSQSGTIRILPQLPLQGYVTKSDVSCYGGTNGIASAYYSGGQGTIHYLWSNASITPQIDNLTVGTYTLMITDSLGCHRHDTAVITEPPQLNITVDSLTHVSCFGYSDGNIWTTTSGGSGHLAYTWLLNGSLFPEVTDDIENISAGNYLLTVTDSLFCTVSQDIVINEPVQTFFTDSIHVISCNNGADGYWQITPAGLYTPYIAIFNTGDTISTDTVPSPFTNGLNAGTYSCQITAANGCLFDFNMSLQQPLPITVGLSNINPVICYSDSTGSILLDDVHGGKAPYSYAWSNGLTSNPANGLVAGIYNVTITDSNNCTIEETYTVDQPYEPVKFFPTVYNTSCQQAEDGAVAVNLENIFWSPFNNVFYLYDSTGNLIDSVSPGVSIGNLPPGHYTGTVINENGCRATNIIFVDKGPDDCIKIPNLVTANGDGFNDVFRVDGGCDYDDFKIVIFTDLGKKVFESENCSFAWDPKDVKASANTVFYYYIQVIEKGRVYDFRNSININY